MTIWKKVPGLEEVYVSSDGQLTVKGRHKKPYRRVRNYLGVKIEGRNFLFHRLVLMAFARMPPNAQSEGLHLDGNPENNSPKNLKWGTHAENMKMDRGHNHAHRGEGNPNRKLSTFDVNKIRNVYLNRNKHQWGRRKLANQLGISETQVLLIAQQKYGGWS